MGIIRSLCYNQLFHLVPYYTSKYFLFFFYTISLSLSRFGTVGGKVLRTLCLELDEASLLLQISAFREDPAEAARALGCEGRG